MDFASNVQPIGRLGEIAYISSVPNYSPIQPIPPIRGGQENFFGFTGNKYSYNSSHYNDKNKENLGSITEKARDIQTRVNSGKEVITPGMLLDIVV